MTTYFIAEDLKVETIPADKAVKFQHVDSESLSFSLFGYEIVQAIIILTAAAEEMGLELPSEPEYPGLNIIIQGGLREP